MGNDSRHMEARRGSGDSFAAQFAALLVAAATVTLSTTGCTTGEEPPSATRPNVIVLMVDTMRADHMSTYGYHRETTSAIDRFSESAAVFERTRSQAACTFPSINSLLTSRYPAIFEAQNQGEMGIPEGVISVAEVLEARGYATIAVSASPIFRATPSQHNPGAGFGRGFQIFDEECQWREAGLVNVHALEHLSGVDQPFFAYLHYMDPHDPYLTPKPYVRRFAGAYEGHEFIANGNPNPIAEMLYDQGPKLDIRDEDMEHLVDLYDDEIAYFDHEFGKLIERLNDSGLLDSSLLILAADHGEEFMEHGHVKHCRGLYDTLTWTPLIVRPPGGIQGRRIDAPVENLDIVPTILDYLDIPVEGLELHGRSMRPLIDGEDMEPQVVFSGQGKWRSADDGRTKLILDALASEHQMYDLVNDPGETSDIFDPESTDARRLGRELRRWMEGTAGGMGTAEAIAAAKAKERELKALGYLQ